MTASIDRIDWAALQAELIEAGCQVRAMPGEGAEIAHRTRSPTHTARMRRGWRGSKPASIRKACFVPFRFRSRPDGPCPNLHASPPQIAVGKGRADTGCDDDRENKPDTPERYGHL
jgi:hypothetical protein